MLNGRMGFHDKPCMGFANLQAVDSACLLTAAESVEDTVAFYNDSPAGTIMVDCHTSQPSEPFSIVVQGDALVQLLAPCFSCERFLAAGRWNSWKAPSLSDLRF